MNWNDHGNLIGKHAILSASKYYWTNYDDERLKIFWKNMQAVEQGVADHAFACECIKRQQRLPKSANTLTMYVNDCVGFRMTPEQVLYFSDNCFGTCDAIRFDEKTNTLRIHDLKTGDTPANMRQLEVYAALFCLEYRKKPEDISIELRIYQGREAIAECPDPNDIRHIMNLIIRFDKIIEKEKKKL